MERSVLLVDAGYLYAQGGLACHGTKARKTLVLDARKLLDGLTRQVEDHCQLPLLRTYWYDGAERGMPTAEHQQIAQVPYVKLRLGRLTTRRRQKGVDALIYRDLMTLATERSVVQAYLLSGDDDLREGVLFAQDRGMRVILLGIVNKKRTNQSRELLYEADDQITVSSQLLKRSLALAPAQPELEPEPGTGVESKTGFDVGWAYGASWLDGTTGDALQTLRKDQPQIPKNLDIDLVRASEVALRRSLRNEEPTKREVRRGFWAAIDASPASDTNQPSSA